MSSARSIALGGVLAALAVVILCLGTLIPIATFVCPMGCCLILAFVNALCGRTIAWAWYGAVAVLGALLAPDKEAAAVFAFLGYYPIIKATLEKSRLKLLWKLLLFNGSVLAMYALLIGLLGMDALGAEFREMGAILCAVMLVLGNVTFFLLDHLLTKLGRKLGHG